MRHMFCTRFTLDKHTYAAIIDVIEGLLDELCKSARAASSVAPGIVGAVNPKSSSIQNPVRSSVEYPATCPPQTLQQNNGKYQKISGRAKLTAPLLHAIHAST